MLDRFIITSRTEPTEFDFGSEAQLILQSIFDRLQIVSFENRHAESGFNYAVRVDEGHSVLKI